MASKTLDYLLFKTLKILHYTMGQSKKKPVRIYFRYTFLELWGSSIIHNNNLGMGHSKLVFDPKSEPWMWFLVDATRYQS